MMAAPRPRLIAVACLIAAGVILIDQGTKAAALASLSEQERIPLLGDALGLQLAFNPGAILSFGSDATWLITLIGLVAVVVLGVAVYRARTLAWATGIGLILGGAIGNLIDRLFAPPGFGRGHVTDFLAYGELFIGNLADVALGIGIIVLLVSVWRNQRSGSGEPVEARPAATASAGDPS